MSLVAGNTISGPRRMGRACENEELGPGPHSQRPCVGWGWGEAGPQAARSAPLMSFSASSQAKTSEEMGHWLGLLLSESGSKTDPEEFTYDYVDADRVSCIVSAAKTSLL